MEKELDCDFYGSDAYALVDVVHDVQGESQPSKDQTVTEQQQETVEQEDWESYR